MHIVHYAKLDYALGSVTGTQLSSWQIWSIYSTWVDGRNGNCTITAHTWSHFLWQISITTLNLLEGPFSCLM